MIVVVGGGGAAAAATAAVGRDGVLLLLLLVVMFQSSPQINGTSEGCIVTIHILLGPKSTYTLSPPIPKFLGPHF